MSVTKEQREIECPHMGKTRVYIEVSVQFYVKACHVSFRLKLYLQLDAVYIYCTIFHISCSTVHQLFCQLSQNVAVGASLSDVAIALAMMQLEQAVSTTDTD
jgi:hypothetical protein